MDVRNTHHASLNTYYEWDTLKHGTICTIFRSNLRWNLGFLPMVHPRHCIFKSKNITLVSLHLTAILHPKPLWYLSVDGCAQVLTCIPKFEVTLKLCVNERGNLVKNFFLLLIVMFGLQPVLGDGIKFRKKNPKP